MNYTLIANNTIEPNTGFWIYSSINNNTITITVNNGYTIPERGLTNITLHTGWNIIGTSIDTAIIGNNIGTIYYYDTTNNKYCVANSLIANTGYLIKSDMDNNTITL